MRTTLNYQGIARIWCVAAATAGLCLAAADTRLIRAVRAGDTDQIRSLLKQHVDVNGTQGDGSTALHWAAYLDNALLADLLLQAGAKVNAINSDGATPLYVACDNAGKSVAEKLLAAGANPDLALLNGETALMACARAGETQVVEALIAHRAELDVKESAHHQTALMWAAAQGHPAVVELLLKAGADYKARSLSYPQTVVYADAGQGRGIQTISRGGSTALLFAARSGDGKSVRLLLEAGADPNDALPDGTSALVVAAHSGNMEAGIALVENGADPNTQGSGYSALHAAVLRSDLKLVKALLAHRGNPNLRMTKGTPVRRSSADFNLPGSLVGSTPYFLAARFLEPEIMRALAAAGADPKLAMPDGTTPVMAAAGMGARRNGNRRGISSLEYLGKIEPESRALETVTTAVQLGGDVNTANNAGDTALHSAAGQGYDTIVQFLVDSGAHLNARNKRGETPLGVARPKGTTRQSIVTASAAAGVDFSSSVETPESGRPSTAALLRKLGATE